LTLDSYGFIRQGHVTDDIKKTVLESRTIIEDAVAVTNEDLAELQKYLGQLRPASTNKESAEQAGQAVQQGEPDENVIKQLEGERVALHAARKILEELLSKTEEKAVDRAMTQTQHGVQVTFGNIHLPPSKPYRDAGVNGF
jgi:hypothetical protein